MRPTDPVGDDETLYRNVRSKYCTRDDPPRITSEGFFDPQRRPSVDRAGLCADDPQHTRLGLDGVAVLIAYEVRMIDDVALYDPFRPFEVDIEPKPIERDPELADNPAHAQIFLRPASDNDKVFRRLRISLARLANTRSWAILPEFD